MRRFSLLKKAFWPFQVRPFLWKGYPYILPLALQRLPLTFCLLGILLYYDRGYTDELGVLNVIQRTRI